MPLLRPKFSFRRITDIPLSFFVSLGVRALILDVDNTLTTHDNPVPASGVIEWLEEMKAAGIKMIILSNNSPGRVEPFAESLGLDFAAKARKPLPQGALRACSLLKIAPSHTALIGDQLFTDILCGNLAGLTTIFVEHIEAENGRFFRFKRKLERLILKNNKL